jgi:site-specific DNA recombinase
MAKLDSLVVNNVKERLLTPKRLTNILQALIERQGAKDLAVQGRRSALEAEVAIKNDKLKRLYLAIENGIVELDNELKERVRSLKTERDIAQTSLDRIAIQGRAGAAINLDRLNAFSSLMCEKLDTGDTQARKSYLRSVISHVEVDDDKIRIIGDKATLAAVIAGRQTQATNVRGFVRNWRARRDSNS